MPKRRGVAAVLGLTSVLLALVVPPPASSQVAPEFTRVEAFATKTGFRGIFTWEATQPVRGVVRWGTSSSNLNGTAQGIPGAPDAAQMAVASLWYPGFPLPDETIYYRIEDEITGATTETHTFEADNAYRAWDGETYTIDLLVQLDADSLPPEIPHDQALEEIAQGISVMAERTYDALDGDARIGDVLVTDTTLDFAVNTPVLSYECVGGHTHVADLLVQTSVPFSSSAYLGAISSPCQQMNLGRLGQLLATGWADDLHFGYVATHELMHYAFFTPDLYSLGTGAISSADCRNLDWDGSLMHNTGGWDGTEWVLTELDRSPEVTPCQHGIEPWSWDEARGDTDGDGVIDDPRYTELPSSDTPPVDGAEDTVARGAPDGGVLNILILDREPGGSTLRSFVPDDSPT